MFRVLVGSIIVRLRLSTNGWTNLSLFPSPLPYLLCIANKGKENSSQNLDAVNILWPLRLVEVDNRLCLKCNVIEDEIHFLTKCSLFDTKRQKFLKELKSVSKYLALNL